MARGKKILSQFLWTVACGLPISIGVKYTAGKSGLAWRVPDSAYILVVYVHDSMPHRNLHIVDVEGTYGHKNLL